MVLCTKLLARPVDLERRVSDPIFTGTTMAQSKSPDTEQLMNDYFAVRAGDRSKLDVLSASFTFHTPTEEIHGPDGLISLQEEMDAAFPDGDLTVDELVVGDDVAFWEWTLSGTHQGPWQDIPATGNRIEIHGLSKTVIDEGKIQENWAYFDTASLNAQLEGDQ